jgi:DNA-binding NarL/FixJ family response regulator
VQHASPLRILIADDHCLFREAVRQILALDANVLVVGEAADGEEAAERCRHLQSHVLLLDVDRPRLSGIEALARIRETCAATAVVLLTARIQRQELFEALLLGVRGVILKTAETDRLLDCVRSVAGGATGSSRARSVNSSPPCARQAASRVRPGLRGRRSRTASVRSCRR